MRLLHSAAALLDPFPRCPRSWVEPKARPYVDQLMAMAMGASHGTQGLAKAKEE